MEQKVHDIVKRLFDSDIEIKLTRPEAQFGDYATNVALQLAKKVGQNPREIAEQIAGKLKNDASISEVSIAGPGFINLRMSDESLLKNVNKQPAKILEGQSIVAEYSDPNPFKVLHAGHLYTTIVGDTIARLLENAGATVHRVNFGGDVGMHVAKNMWAIIRHLGGEFPEKLSELDEDLHIRSAWLSARYVEGNEAYETNDGDKAGIVAINKRLYQLHTDNDHESDFAKIYWTCRDWSYEYFKLFYDELQVTQFEKYYPESATTPTGIEIVQRELANGVYEKSDGAVVFKGEPYGLHTRVFINSEGLPTYEAKDVGLIMQKWMDYHFDRSIIITGNDILEYMKVVQKSIEQFEPELVSRSTHLTHGNLKLAGGKKMSSRKGTVLLALDVLEAATESQKAQHDTSNQDTVLGAIKYAFLMNRIGGDIVYDSDVSVSLHGNSGPYLQYAHARSCSIIAKSSVSPAELDSAIFDNAERALILKLSDYSEVISRAISDLTPHHICNYLYELAQEFNRFYEKSRIIGDAREAIRLSIITIYRQRLADGLALLGIVAPEKI